MAIGMALAQNNSEGGAVPPAVLWRHAPRSRRIGARRIGKDHHSKEEPMAEKEAASTSTLAGGEYEAEDVLADAEPWEPIETKLVVWSFIIAGIVLVIGLFVVPTSVLH